VNNDGSQDDEQQAYKYDDYYYMAVAVLKFSYLEHLLLVTK
jgi:hypothetical protein